MKTAISSLLRGFWWHHRQVQPLLVFAFGAGGILLVRLWLEEFPTLELMGGVVGAVLLATAHGLNLRDCRACCSSLRAT